jgi:hypothetical protein
MEGNSNQFLERITSRIDGVMTGASLTKDDEAEYLKIPAPNAVEWVTGIDFWNVPSTFEHARQYQIIRDAFNLRCPICNSMRPEDIDAWGKGRIYLESEALLVWSEVDQDFVCPKCKTTQREFFIDRILNPYNEMIVIAGMRSGKSFLGAHIGGYFEHFLITRGVRGRGYLQRMLKQEKSEWFEVTFAASTAEQAQQTIYAKYREMRHNSPWVNRYMTWVQQKEREQIGQKDKWAYRVNDDAILDGYLMVRFNRTASDSAGIAGKTRIMASIDEWARLVNTEGTRSAQELYRVLNQSLKTVRAAQEMNGLPSFLGMMINVTSPISQDDPAMVTYAQATAGTARKIYAWKGATWEFNPQMPRHLFDEEFAKDPVGASRDFGASPPNAEMPFVDDPLRFWSSIDWKRNPAATFESTELSDATGKQYVGLELKEAALDHVNTHYLFGDAGLNFDSFALVCAHPKWVSSKDLEDTEGEGGLLLPLSGGRGRVEPFDPLDVVYAEDMGTFMGGDFAMGGDGAMIIDAQEQRRRAVQAWQTTPAMAAPYDHKGEMLCTVIDFAVRIVPTQGRDIWFNSIVSIIEQLRKRIRIAGVGFDHWSSIATIQQIRSMGILSQQVALKAEHFMGFLRMAYNSRVSLLPPSPEDMVGLSEKGNLIIGVPQEQMEGRSVALVEMLKLSRSPDLRKFFNPNKGKVRGRDSDDLARCYIGVHFLIQNSIVDETDTKKKRARRKRQLATDTPLVGTVARGRSW